MIPKPWVNFFQAQPQLSVLGVALFFLRPAEAIVDRDKPALYPLQQVLLTSCPNNIFSLFVS